MREVIEEYKLLVAEQKDFIKDLKCQIDELRRENLQLWDKLYEKTKKTG